MGKSPRRRQKGDVSPFLTARSFGTDVISKEPYTWLFDGGPPGSPNDGASVNSNSVMVDFKSDRYEAGDHPVQPCDHLHITKAFGSRTVVTEHNWFPFIGRTEWKFNRDGALHQVYSWLNTMDVDSILPPPPDNVMFTHARKAVKSMIQQFPTEISLPNTLMELKDVPACLDTIRDVADVVANARRRKPPSVQTAANIHAGYNFGVSPLIGDILTIDSIYKIVHGRLEHLKRTKGKWTQVGQRSTFSKPHKFGLYHHEMALDEWVAWEIVSIDYEINSTAMVRNDLSWVDSWEGIVRGLVGAMGLDNPLLVAWEATPFSWAIDYVVPVGAWLDGFKFQQLVGWQVKRLCTSWKAKARVNVYLHPRGGSTRTLGTFEITRYVRNIGLPPTFGDIGTPNAKQLSLLAAVAIGRN